MMSALPRAPEASPPAGYRPKIGLKVALEAAIRQAVCPDCGERLGRLDNVHRDHVPPLQMRVWCEATGDTIPAANDPEHIVLRHANCHNAKTSGGATKAKAKGDVTEIYRTRRLAKKQAAFRDRLLRRDTPEADAEPPKKKTGRKLQGRGFESRKKSKESR